MTDEDRAKNLIANEPKLAAAVVVEVMGGFQDLMRTIRDTFGAAAQAMRVYSKVLTDEIERNPEWRAYVESVRDEDDADEPIHVPPPT